MLISKVEKAAAEAAAAAHGDLAAALDERRNCVREMQVTTPPPPSLARSNVTRAQRLYAQLAVQSHEQSVRAAASCLVTAATPKILYKVPPSHLHNAISSSLYLHSLPHPLRPLIQPVAHNASTEAALAAR